jgi:hypothetical protein
MHDQPHRIYDRYFMSRVCRLKVVSGTYNIFSSANCELLIYLLDSIPIVLRMECTNYFVQKEAHQIDPAFESAGNKYRETKQDAFQQ